LGGGGLPASGGNWGGGRANPLGYLSKTEKWNQGLQSEQKEGKCRWWKVWRKQTMWEKEEKQRGPKTLVWPIHRIPYDQVVTERKVSEERGGGKTMQAVRPR